MNDETRVPRGPTSIETRNTDADNGSSHKRTKRIRVYVNEFELAAIRRRAYESSMQPSPFLRTLGLGLEIRSTVDAQVVNQLANLNVSLEKLLECVGPNIETTKLLNEIREVIRRI